jgi:hypothetical protein
VDPRRAFHHEAWTVESLGSLHARPVTNHQTVQASIGGAATTRSARLVDRPARCVPRAPGAPSAPGLPPAASPRAPLVASGPPRSRSAARRRRGSLGSPKYEPIASARLKSGSIRTWSSSARAAGGSASRRSYSRPSSSSEWRGRLRLVMDVRGTRCHKRLRAAGRLHNTHCLP